MGAYILIAVNFGLFIISALYVLKKRNLSNLLKTVIADKASIIYVTYLLLLFTVVHNKVPFWGDELRYWASLPKVLYQYSGALQLHRLSVRLVLIIFQEYLYISISYRL